MDLQWEFRDRRQMNFLSPNKYVFPENKFQQTPYVRHSGMCLIISWHGRRELSQFSECSSNPSALNPILSIDVPGKSAMNQFFFFGTQVWLQCLDSLFPAMKKQETYPKAFLLTDAKMTFQLQHRARHASRHRLMHLMQWCWFKWRPTPQKYSCYCNGKWGMKE